MAFDYGQMASMTTASVMNSIENIKMQPYFVPAFPMTITDEDVKSSDELRGYLMNRGDIYESTIGTYSLTN